MRWFAAIGLVAAVAAHAGEQSAWQGRVLDASGAPVHGAVTLELAVFAAESGGGELAAESFSATAADGFVALALSEALTAAIATAPEAWLEVRRGVEVLGPRQRVFATPSAVQASRIPVVASPGSCGAGEQGQIRWDTSISTLRVCVDGAWRAVSAAAGTGPGSVQTNPVASCADVTSAGEGRFWIDFGAGATLAACEPAGGWTVVLDYRDDNAVDDIPNAASGIAAGFRNDNAFYVGNASLNALDFHEAEWCMSDGTQSRCFPITDADWSFTLGDVDSLVGARRRVIGALSGQVDDGRTEEGANGDFYATHLSVKPPVCPSPTYAEGLDRGHIRQWLGDDANWHTWGNGLALFRDGSNYYGVNNELTWAAQNLAPPTQCGPEWERFWIRVREITPGLAGSNRVSAVADCAAVRAARPSAPDGFYWIDPDGGSTDNAGKVSCDYTNNWTHVVHYLDDNATNDLPDSRWVIAQGFTSANATYLGNSGLNALSFTTAQWCTSNGASTACFPINDADWTYTGGDVNELVGNKRRVIAALSGQVDDGRTEQSAAGRLYASATQAAPPICPDPSYGNLPGNGYLSQWAGNDADWHAWGNGLSLYKNGSNTYGVHNEIAWGAENQTPNTRCGPEWELFYIRVR